MARIVEPLRHNREWFGLTDEHEAAITEFTLARYKTRRDVAYTASKLIVGNTGAGSAGVFKLDEDTHLRLLAGMGWNQGPDELDLICSRHSGGALLVHVDPPVIFDGLPSPYHWQISQRQPDQGVGLMVAVCDANETARYFLGVFSILPREFRPDEVSFVRAIAHVVSLHFSLVAKGRQPQLGDDAQRLGTRIHQLLDGSLDLDSAFQNLTPLMRTLLQFDSMYFLTVDQDEVVVRWRYAADEDAPMFSLTDTQLIDRILVEAMVQSGTGVIFMDDRDISTGHRFEFLKPSVEAGLRSTLAVPLQVKGDLYGVLVFKSASPRAYSLQHLTTAAAIADHSSGAIHRILRISDGDNEMRRLSVLVDLGHAITCSKSLASLLDETIDSIRKVTPIEHMAVDVIDEDNGRYIRVFGNMPLPADESHILDLSSSHEFLKCSWKFMYLDEHDSTQPPVDMINHTSRTIRTTLEAPLYFEGKRFGRVLFLVPTPSQLTAECYPFLSRVSTQLGPAVALKREQMADRRAARQSELLARIEFLTQSSLNVDGWYHKFAELVQCLIPFDRIAISLVDIASETIVDSYQAGVMLPDRPLRIARPIAGTITDPVLRSGKGMFMDLRNPTGPFDWYQSMRERMTQAGLWSRLSVPLITRYNMHAVLHLASKRPCAYSERDVETAERIASLVSGTIWNSAEYFLALKTADELETGSDLTLDGTGSSWDRKRSTRIFDSTAQGDALPDGHEFISGVDSPTWPPIASVRRISVVVIGVAELSKRSLTTLLNSRDVEIMAETESVSVALELVCKLAPRIILFETRAINESVLDFVADVRSKSPRTQIILLGASNTAQEALEALRFGVSGIMSHEISPEHLMDGIRQISEGGTVLEPRMLKSLVEQMPDFGLPPNEERELLSALSDSDRAILGMLARGLTNAEIATETSFAAGTIKNRIARIYKQLGLTDRAQAAAFAVRFGLTD